MHVIFFLDQLFMNSSNSSSKSHKTKQKTQRLSKQRKIK